MDLFWCGYLWAICSPVNDPLSILLKLISVNWLVHQTGPWWYRCFGWPSIPSLGWTVMCLCLPQKSVTAKLKLGTRSPSTLTVLSIVTEAPSRPLNPSFSVPSSLGPLFYMVQCDKNENSYRGRNTQCVSLKEASRKNTVASSPKCPLLGEMYTEGIWEQKDENMGGEIKWMDYVQILK